ncbi:MAG: hypothetical protein JWO42_4210 [Chloroflexi bacterium]|nr:hypothetical protein [Chloroflexota bacterium]
MSEPEAPPSSHESHLGDSLHHLGNSLQHMPFPHLAAHK